MAKNLNEVGVHPVARDGFEKSVDFYENARPSYPTEAVSFLEQALRLIPNESHVVDLGAGTGKFTRLLVNQGYKLTAVEPAAAMRQKFTQVLPGIEVVDGSSWSLPLSSNSQDAVICAQSFHWFANLKTLQEIHRVLKPGGGIGMIWNLENNAEKAWVGQLRNYYEQFELNSPQYRLGLWKQVWEDEAAKLLFSPLQYHSIYHFINSTKEDILMRILSKSYIGCQSDQAKEKIKANLERILDDASDIEYTETGLVAFPYSTDIVWCTKL